MTTVDTAIARGSAIESSGSRASISEIFSSRVTLRRASQPASASPTGPAPTIVTSSRKDIGRGGLQNDC